jgi:fructoselysine-6-P-deglycase FrlB-like protein
VSAVPAAGLEPPRPGALLLAEIREQPAVLRRLLEHEREYADVAAHAVRRGADLVRMVGHGSSDNAASYGVYAFGLLPGWTALRDSISLSVYYGAQVDLRGSTVLALLAGCIAGRGPELVSAIRRTADLLEELLPTLEAQVPELAVPLAFVGRMFVIGRGPEFATAREISLKLLETCRVAAEPLTATDLVHGPVAAIDAFFPVWTIASADESLPAVREAALRARDAGAVLIVSGTAADEVPGEYHLPVPRPPLPLLTPLLSVAPGQLLAWALAQARGLDPDRPSGLSKVTIVP